MTIAEKVIDILNPLQPEHSRLGFKLLDKDPILETARKFGFKVVEYELEPYPLQLAGVIAVRMLGMIIVSSIIAHFLYFHVANKSSVLKWGSIGGLISAFLAWPLVTGMSGVMLLDFWRPALGFRSAMLVWDIFHIRTREEVSSWNFGRFLAHLWAFPKEEEEIAERTREEGYARNARWENLKGMPKVAIEFVLLFVTLYAIPPFELTVGMSRFAYHCYCDMLGLSILMALALFGDGLLKGMGIILNVEMADMFENPLGTTNIRLFWSHWNRAIATVLHRVVFGGGRTTRQNLKKKAAARKNSGGNRLDALRQKRAHLDQLSETEHEFGKTDDEDEKSAGAKARQRKSGLRPMTQVNGAGSPSKANGSSSSTSSASKPKGKFLPKAVAAIATFAMSGIFHEHITYWTLGFANGENFLFFLLNGVATVVSTWFKRTFPEINARIPTLVSVLLLHAFFLAVIPLFCSPFIRSGFFTQLDALKYEIFPIRSRPRGSFIYLFGN